MNEDDPFGIRNNSRARLSAIKVLPAFGLMVQNLLVILSILSIVRLLII